MLRDCKPKIGGNWCFIQLCTLKCVSACVVRFSNNMALIQPPEVDQRQSEISPFAASERFTLRRRRRIGVLKLNPNASVNGAGVCTRQNLCAQILMLKEMFFFFFPVWCRWTWLACHSPDLNLTQQSLGWTQTDWRQTSSLTFQNDCRHCKWHNWTMSRRICGNTKLICLTGSRAISRWKCGDKTQCFNWGLGMSPTTFVASSVTSWWLALVQFIYFFYTPKHKRTLVHTACTHAHTHMFGHTATRENCCCRGGRDFFRWADR